MGRKRSLVGRVAAKIYHEGIPRRLKSLMHPHARLLRVQLIQFLQGKEYPVKIELETNSSCTRKCSYCPIDPNDKTVLETEVFHSVIDQLRDWGYQGILSPHTYNEPLTDKRIFNFLTYISKNLPNAEIVLLTNGDLLSQKTVERLVDIGVSRIYVSLHNPLPKKTEKNLRALDSQYKSINLVDLRPGHRINPLSNRGGLIDIGPTKPHRRCSAVDMMIIRADGNVVLCCNDYNKTFIAGNVKNRSLPEIWNDENFKNLRDRIRNGSKELPVCKACEFETNWTYGE